ncbi:formate dehydrogenase accessory protein FdhE [Chloroflexota bacterium]
MTAKETEELLKKLEEEGERKGIPARFLEFYQRLFRLHIRAEKRIGKVKPVLKKEVANKRLQRGQPLITFKELSIDWALLKEIYTEVRAVFADFPDLFGELPELLRVAESHTSLPKAVVKAWFERSELPPAVYISNTKENLLLQAIIHATIKPFLSSRVKTLTTMVDQERWRRGYCPVCGGQPDFAFLDKERGARWLLCSHCDAEWLFQRLQCPYCGTQNQDSISYFTDEKGIYRLYVCDQCRKYIKTIDLRPFDAGVSLPLERVLTLDMDIQAQEKGYSSPPMPHS